jgi:hypothetical protein
MCNHSLDSRVLEPASFRAAKATIGVQVVAQQELTYQIGF